MMKQMLSQVFVLIATIGLLTTGCEKILETMTQIFKTCSRFSFYQYTSFRSSRETFRSQSMLQSTFAMHVTIAARRSDNRASRQRNLNTSERTLSANFK